MVATANRGLLISPFLTYGIYLLWHRPVPLAALVVGGAIIFAGFSYTGYQREYRSYGPLYDRDLAAEGYPGVLRYFGPALRYVEGTSQVMDKTIRIFPSRVDHPFGREFFAPILHQPSVDLYLNQVFGLSFIGFGVALGAINAFYLDFGLPGVVVGFLLFGSVSALLYRRARALGGRWVVGYALWMSNLLLSNYGHPFAYLTVALIPMAILTVLRPRRAALGERSPALPQPRTPATAIREPVRVA
jgi:hypothetical protein